MSRLTGTSLKIYNKNTKNMDEDTKQLLGEVIEHVDKRFEETKEYVEEKSIETRRHFDVVAESLQQEIHQVAEGVITNTRQINVIQKDITGIKDKVEEIDVRLVGVEDKVDGLETRFDGLEKDMKIVKTDVGFIKAELSQKVSREEFTFLESRVADLENKK
ncbi:MAG: hypothetical protein PHE77_01260 [Candidatus Pacebacteria bacterium]|nr:hypothetical protein [Candidatus Paceibacterota bacterium]